MMPFRRTRLCLVLGLTASASLTQAATYSTCLPAHLLWQVPA